MSERTQPAFGEDLNAPANSRDAQIAACEHDWRDIDGRWLCIECRAEKPYAAMQRRWYFVCHLHNLYAKGLLRVR